MNKQEIELISRRDFVKYCGGLGLGILANPSTSILDIIPTQTPHLIMQLDWKYNVQFAGLLLADYYKLYQQRGLKVEILPVNSQNVFEQIAENPLILGCGEQDVILAAQVQGYPVKAIATMFQTSPLGLMSIPEKNIHSLYDLVGQKIGIHGNTKKVMELVINTNGLSLQDIKIVPISYQDKYERLQSGELAAVQCYSVDEPIGFNYKTGIQPNILKFSDYGYDAYVQVIFAHQQLLDHHPEWVNQFLKASFAGWKLALDNINQTAKIVVDFYIKPDSEYYNLDDQTKSLQLISDYITWGINPDQIGTISANRWQKMSEKLAQYGIIDQVPLLTDSLDSNLWLVA
jgi:ABC-type nitrate/sulfonate/bicarbonate transport system substrate-binding protein